MSNTVSRWEPGQRHQQQIDRDLKALRLFDYGLSYELVAERLGTTIGDVNKMLERPQVWEALKARTGWQGDRRHYDGG